MKNFIQPGRIITVPAPADITSGSGVLVGAIFGVSCTDAKSGDDIEIATEGVFELAKTSAQAWTVGAKVYWDDTAKAVTTTATSNTLIGNAVEAAANPSATGKVRLAV
jgi:predicted RecA/RadA family phage recombinase